METDIRANLAHPRQLEQLYRQHKVQFKQSFERIYPEIQHELVAQVWYERLHSEPSELRWGSRSEHLLIGGLVLFAGLIAKLPDLLGLDQDLFFARNIGFVVFPVLMTYFAWRQRLSVRTIATLLGLMAASALYINLLPAKDQSDTLLLACMHLPLLLWIMTGYSYVGEAANSPRRTVFLRYNGDLIVMTGLILLAGGVLSAVTVGLFELIGVPIEQFYFRYVGIWGLVAAPIVATSLVQNNPQLVKYISPVIARGFTPLVFVMLLVYLITIAFTAQNPYSDRNFLLLFNGLLVGVMALILFSITDLAHSTRHKRSVGLLVGLVVLTVIVNGIALSAILFRIASWGFTPNRLAVLGSNVLILAHLVLVGWSLLNVLQTKRTLADTERQMTSFLPVYGLWALVVVVVFPLVFGW